MSLRLLFLADDSEDYLADSILHGLRQIEHVYVVDYPKKECLYQSGLFSSDAPELGVRGGGFSLYGLLDSQENYIDRNQIMRKLETGWFDAIVVGNIWRQWGTLLQWKHYLNLRPLIILDGEDDVRLYPFSGTRIRQFGFSSGLRKLLGLTTTHYFKRELTQRSFSLPYLANLHQISFSIPEEKIDREVADKTQVFPAHIVDEELVAIGVGRSDYAFDNENLYRDDLRSSSFCITTKRAGWDCLRHYEIAASGSVICFKNLEQKPPTCAPHDLKDSVNCISYASPAELLQKIESLSQADQARLQTQALKWAQSKTTKVLALELLFKANLL